MNEMGHFSPEALEKFQAMCADGMDFSEGNTYDFAKCIMPDGEVYGVEPGESCKQGKPISDGEASKKKKEKGTGSSMAKLKKAFIKKTGREMSKKEMAKAQNMIGVPIPKGSSAEKELQKMVPKGEKVGLKTA